MLCAQGCPNLQGILIGLLVEVDEGMVNIFNDAGSLDVPSGQDAYVEAANTPPQFMQGNAGNLGINPLSDPEFRAGENPIAIPDQLPSGPETLAPPPPPPTDPKGRSF